jgi:hypothetical protein
MSAQIWPVAIASKAPVPVSFLELRRRLHRPGLWPVRVDRVRVEQVLPQALAHGRDFGWGNRRGKAQYAASVKLIALSRRQHVSPCLARRSDGGAEVTPGRYRPVPN